MFAAVPHISILVPPLSYTSPAPGDCVSKHAHSTTPSTGRSTTHRAMLRLTVLAATVACFNSFLSPLVVMQSPHRIVHSRRASPEMSSSSETSSASSPSTTSTPTELSGQIDRRTLLKVIPATLAAGMIGVAVGVAPESVSARATPKAAPSGTSVVVLGGNGFVGSKVCEMLVEAGETHVCHDYSDVNGLVRVTGGSQGARAITRAQ